jgi:putative oxidoreductase
METDRVIRMLSLGLGILMLFHGVDKLSNGVDHIVTMLNNVGIPYAKYVAYGVYIGEVVAPLLLIFGQYVRVSGSIIAFNMMVAIVLAHRNDIFTLGKHGAWSIEVPLLYLIIALSLALWRVPKKSV